MTILRAADAPTFELNGIMFTGYAAPRRGSRQLCTWRIRVAPGWRAERRREPGHRARRGLHRHRRRVHRDHGRRDRPRHATLGSLTRSAGQALVGEVEPAQLLEPGRHRRAAVAVVPRPVGQLGEQLPGVFQVTGQRLLAGLFVMRRPAQPAVGVVTQLGQPQRRLHQAVPVAPEPAVRVETVLRQQRPAMRGDQVHRLQDVLEDRFGDEVPEADAYPAGFDPLAAGKDLPLETVRALDVDAEQAVAVRAGARATAPGLDAEQVVEQRHHEVVVQVPAAWPADHEGHDRQPLGVEVAQDLDVRVGTPRVDRPAQQVLLPGADQVGADRLLELEHQARPDRVDDRRRAALLALRRVGDVVVLGRVHIVDGAAPGYGRYPVA